MSATRQGRTLASKAPPSGPGIARRYPASASRSEPVTAPTGHRPATPARTTARHCQALPFPACPTAEKCVCPPQAVAWAHSRAHVTTRCRRARLFRRTARPPDSVGTASWPTPSGCVPRVETMCGLGQT